MTNETDLIKHLKELDEWSTSGIWGQYSPSHGPWREHANANRDWSKYDTSHHVSVMRETGPYRVGEFRHANDAAFAEACVNAYRSGVLVPADALEAAQTEIQRCHERLEITHEFKMHAESSGLERVEIPFEERQKQPDGIECRDAAIALLEQSNKAAQARIAELEADCSRLNEGIEAIRQFGSDTLSGPTDSSHDTRDWQRAAVKVMTWRARLLLNGYDWDAGDEEDTPSARAALEGKG